MGLNELRRIGSGFQLFAQGNHKYAEGSNIAFPCASPEFLCNEGVCQNLSYILCQQTVHLLENTP